MADSFYRVRRSLRADNGVEATLALLIALALGTAWLVWACCARVTRYEVSDTARLELKGAAYPIQANASGELMATSLVLGREVHSGDVLAQLDDREQQLSLQQERTRLASLEPQLTALRLQMQSEDQGRAGEHEVLGLSLAAAKAQYNEAQAQADLARKDADRARKLRAEGIISDADAQRSLTDAEAKRAAAQSLHAVLLRLAPEQQVRERDRELHQRQILGDIAKIQADMSVSAANIRRLEYDIAQRLIRAPVSGRLGECATLRPGVHIAEGQQLGMLLPHGSLKMVAEFQPADALGKVRPAQHAVVRLQGFPWTQFGTVPAEVSRVAGDIRDGHVRVELAIDAARAPRIPLQHGLPGSVEVEVERISPLALVMRSAGRLLGAR